MNITNVKNIHTNKKHLTCVICFAIMILFIIQSKYICEAFYSAGIFCAKKLLPALFPFLFLCGVLINSGGLDTLAFVSKPFFKKMKLNPYLSTPYILGLICGFPIGAKVTKQLYTENKISKKEADVLLAGANCASPSFVICTVGAVMLGNQRAGFFIWATTAIMSITLSLVLMPKRTDDVIIAEYNEKEFDLGSVFIASIQSAAVSVINISFLVMFFFVLSSLADIYLSAIGLSKNTKGFLYSMIEITSGCKYITDELSQYKAPLCTFAVGFGGMCVLTQIRAEAHEGANMLYYTFIKLVCGLISSLFVLFLL